MTGHFHHDIVNAAWIVFVAIAGINVLRMLAGIMVAKNIPLGSAIGALTK